jgi:hypothetical protein
VEFDVVTIEQVQLREPVDTAFHYAVAPVRTDLNERLRSPLAAFASGL